MEETFQFLQFQTKKIDILINIPELYIILIEESFKMLNNLMKEKKNIKDDSFTHYAKISEIFNCCIIFLSFPLLFLKRKTFRSSKSLDENKTKEIMYFGPNYCIQCSKKISAIEKTLVLNKEFIIISCKECEEVILPYYCSDEKIFDKINEIDQFLIDFCTKKIIEIKNNLKGKIIEIINETNLEDNKFCVDYLFKDIKHIEILIYSNILQDFYL